MAQNFSILSKTKYMAGLQCPKKIWLAKNAKDKDWLKKAADETAKRLLREYPNK